MRGYAKPILTSRGQFSSKMCSWGSKAWSSKETRLPMKTSWLIGKRSSPSSEGSSKCMNGTLMMISSHGLTTKISSDSPNLSRNLLLVDCSMSQPKEPNVWQQMTWSHILSWPKRQLKIVEATRSSPEKDAPARFYVAADPVWSSMTLSSVKKQIQMTATQMECLIQVSSSSRTSKIRWCQSPLKSTSGSKKRRKRRIKGKKKGKSWKARSQKSPRSPRSPNSKGRPSSESQSTIKWLRRRRKLR